MNVRFARIGDLPASVESGRSMRAQRCARPARCLLAASTLLLWGIAATAIEFDGPFPTHDYPYPVHDSGVEVQADEATVVEWIDNDKVIFSALRAGEERVQHAKNRADRQDHLGPGRVVVWDTRDDTLRDLGEGKLHCAYRGYVSYYWERPNPVTGESEAFFKKGQYGHEVEKPGSRPGNPPKHRDKFTCELHDGPRTAAAPEYWVYQLRVQDGVLARMLKGKSNPASNPVIRVRPDGSRQPLALAWPEMQGAWWEDWAGVYLLNQMMSGGIYLPRVPDRLVMMHPDGRIEYYPIAAAYWTKMTTRRAITTRRGVVLANDLMFVGALFPNRDRSGAYLVRGENVVRLVDWIVGNDRVALDNAHRGIAVSPDGCKLAFKHAEGERFKVKSTIKMIDLCGGE